MTEATIDRLPGHLVADTLGQPGPVPAKEGWGWAFIELAALGINTRRSYLAALLRIVIYPLGFALLAGLGVAWMAVRGDSDLLPAGMVVVIFGFVITAGIAVARSVARSHRRPLLSLVSADLTLDWRRLAIGAGVQAALMLPLLFLAHDLSGQPWRPAPALSVSVLALLLVPLQAASEEILFRGYLTQAFGRIFRSRATIVIAVGILFGALHWNAYGPLTMPYMFAVSVILSLVTLRDGGLELAIGAHTAMNWLGIGEIGALVEGHPAIHITWPYLPVLAVEGVLFYALTRLLVRLACGGRVLTPPQTALTGTG